LKKSLDYRNLEVCPCDVVTDPLPAGQCDLAHVRWTLHWPTARRGVIASMISTLRPGGWLLAEEPDFVTLYQACETDVVARVVTKAIRLLEATSGMNSEYGRELAGDLSDLGLVDVETEGRLHHIRGGLARSGATWLRFTVEKVAERLVASDAVTTAELEETLRLLQDPAFTTYGPLTLAASGRRAS
jgi:hypothetical protein